MARVAARTAGGGESAARPATDREVAEWDTLVAANPGGGEVWGGTCYLDVKQKQGRYRQHRLIVTRPDRPAIAVSVLAKRVPFLGSGGICPPGPQEKTFPPCWKFPPRLPILRVPAARSS
ncbi:hypothetical protein [Leucobacter insecticola]|uniref:hypothetical protein n=1 Tax=Leucobacter insecticola TaxID=2714934 RepID=UPI001FCA76DA|nr:hypothetical protein [Leucobacter insecticola]